MKILIALAILLSPVAGFRAIAATASGSFTGASLDTTPGNEEILLTFPTPAQGKSFLMVRNWQVIGRNRNKEESAQTIKLVRAVGYPVNAKGDIDTNLPPESVYYKRAAILLGNSLQPGWSYKVTYHVAEGSLSIATTLGLESAGNDLTSDWIQVGTGDKGATNSWTFSESLHGPSLTVDVRNASGNGANLGIDYDLTLFSYDPVRFTFGESAIAGLGVTAGSKGYLKDIDASLTNTTLDSVISSFNAYADILFLTDKHLATFLTPQFGFKNEANQNFSTSTYTLGAGMSLDFGFLFPINRDDNPSWLQRLNFLNLARLKRPIDSPRFYVGYDRVFNADSSNRAVITGDTSGEFNRLTYQAAWGLPVLNERSYLTVSWQGYQDLDASHNSFHNLIEIALTYALTEPKADNKAPVNLLIKYINGSLPPNFGSESAVTAGVSITLK